jgi:hypothetical protein
MLRTADLASGKAVSFKKFKVVHPRRNAPIQKCRDGFFVGDALVNAQVFEGGARSAVGWDAGNSAQATNRDARVAHRAYSETP